MKGNSRLERRVQRAGQGQKPEAASLAPHRRLNGSLKRLAEVTKVSRPGRDFAVKRNGYRRAHRKKHSRTLANEAPFFRE